MKIFYKHTGYKIGCVLRYFIARIMFAGKLKVARTSMIGRRCELYIKGKGKIECKGRIILNNDVMLFTKGELTIGDNFGINSYSRIVAHDKIEIGSNVTIGQMVGILDHDHKYQITNNKMSLDGYTTAAIKIGDNVWIGDKSTVLKGVTIGDNVVVGANTLVNKDVPANCVIGGVPFKILKQL
ncbi:MAG: acyltransferase [Flavobacteriales bacterium]|nr:acyltransferase [Flavobacteriales bacterium]